MIDTGFARASSGGLLQYKSYCRHVGQAENIDTSKTVFCKFGISGNSSIGRARVKFPIQRIIMEITMHIIDEDVPLLLSLADMDRLNVYYKNLENRLVHSTYGKKARIKRYYGHPFLTWDFLLQSLFTYP